MGGAGRLWGAGAGEGLKRRPTFPRSILHPAKRQARPLETIPAPFSQGGGSSQPPAACARAHTHAHTDNTGSTRRETWGQTPASLSEPQLPHLQNGQNHSPCTWRPHHPGIKGGFSEGDPGDWNRLCSTRGRGGAGRQCEELERGQEDPIAARERRGCPEAGLPRLGQVPAGLRNQGKDSESWPRESGEPVTC